MPRATRSRPMLHDATSFITEADWGRISATLRLSSRESEIAFLLLADSSEHTIGDRLSISKHTVHSHIERLYRKLAIRSRSQLVVKLFEAYVWLNPPLTAAKDSAERS
jgi:DNA-binding CsgD family transcriptional regulator